MRLLTLNLPEPDSAYPAPSSTHSLSPLVALRTDCEKTNPLPSSVHAAMLPEVLSPLSATTTTRSPSGLPAPRRPAFLIIGSMVDMSFTLPGNSS